MNDITKILPGTTENISIAPLTTFKLGGLARYFYNAKNAGELILALKAAEDLKLPYFIIGWGSNLLVSDQGFDGLLIKNSSDKIEINGRQITAESGANISRLVGEASRAGLSGLEFAAGIPGTVGGAVFGNAGAYGRAFGDTVKSVKVYCQGKVIELDPAALKFGYRESVLKKDGQIVLDATIELMPADEELIKAKVIANLKERKNRIPNEPSAGCVFKNIDLGKTPVDEKRIIKELDISAEEYKNATKYGKLAVGFIIDHLGLGGKTMGGCKISEVHSAFFVNVGNCRAEHVMMMISDVKMRVRNQLGIQLQEEIRYLGF